MTFDSWGHLYFTVAVRRAKSGPFDPILPQVLGAEAFHYPLLPHWLYARIPEQLLRRFISLVNPVLETIFLAVALGLAAAAGISETVLLFAGATYILTPLWFTKVAVGPRVLNFTTRIVSEIIYPLALLIVLLPLSVPTPVTVGLAAALLAAVLLSSKFGLQVVLLVTPLAALFAGSTSLIVALLASPVIALVISRGAFRRQLEQQIDHLLWYVRSLSAGKMPVQSRNALSFLTQWSPEKSRGANLRSLVFNWVARNSLTGMLIRAPVFLVFWFLGGILFVQDRLSLPVWAWAPVAGASIVFAAVSTRWLLFIGEAERYVSHVSILLNLAVVMLATSGNAEWLLWALIGYGALFTLAELFILKDGSNSKIDTVEDATLGYLSSLDRPQTILCYPYHAVAPYRIMVETSHRCVFPVLAGAEFRKAVDDIENYPYIDLRAIDHLECLESIDLLVIAVKDRSERLEDWSPAGHWHLEEVDIEGLQIYRRRHQA